MISIVQNKDVYEIRFPYDEDLIDYVRIVAGRRWHRYGKFWTIPIDKLGFFLNNLKGTRFEHDVKMKSDEDIGVNEGIRETARNEIPDVDISGVHQYVENGGRLFQHQIDCIKFSIGRKMNGNRNGFILADSMGLGKTLEVINLALHKREHEGAKHCLIICCVNSTKYNWGDDIKRHTGGEYAGYILGSRLRRDGTIKANGTGRDKLEDLETGCMYGDEKYGRPLPYFLILNIEALRTTVKDSRGFSRYAITEKIIDLIDGGEISFIALDEVHRNVSPQSIQGKQILAIKKATGCKVEWMPMTGTPIVNKPTDLYTPLYLVGAHDVNSYYKWNQKYCIYGGYGGHNIIGYKNIPELKSILEPNMLRRTKEQVLDLPPKVHHVEYVENTHIQRKLYDEVRGELLNNRDEISRDLNPLAKLLRLRQVNGCPELVDTGIDPRDPGYVNVNAKLKRLLELVNDITESGQKVVIFSNWVEPLRTAYRCLKRNGHEVCSYTGTMAMEDRERNKKLFVTDPGHKIILGTIGAMGTSHTLSVASNVIMLDEPWNAATQDQAEDRCHRLDSKGTVDVYSILTKDTVDERVHDIIWRKRGTSEYIVDDSLDVKRHPELLEMLLS